MAINEAPLTGESEPVHKDAEFVGMAHSPANNDRDADKQAEKVSLAEVNNDFKTTSIVITPILTRTQTQTQTMPPAPTQTPTQAQTQTPTQNQSPTITVTVDPTDKEKERERDADHHEHTDWTEKQHNTKHTRNASVWFSVVTTIRVTITEYNQYNQHTGQHSVACSQWR